MRRQFIAGHLETCIEHHRAIELLIRHELIGSAFVLPRTIADSTLRALWVNKCATDAQVAAIYAEEEKTFPPMREMATAIDRNYETQTFFGDFIANAWHVMCDYAHSGNLQLGRRFTGNELKPSYRDGDIIEVVHVPTTALILLARVFLTSIGCRADSETIERIAWEWAGTG